MGDYAGPGQTIGATSQKTNSAHRPIPGWVLLNNNPDTRGASGLFEFKDSWKLILYTSNSLENQALSQSGGSFWPLGGTWLTQMSHLKPNVEIESRVASPKFPLPKSPPHRETIMHGRREHDFTTVSFDLQSSGGENDTLTIDIDDRRTKSPVAVTITGKLEAAEMPGQLRWLADAIAQHVENNGPAFREHVTSEKMRGGA